MKNPRSKSAVSASDNAVLEWLKVREHQGSNYTNKEQAAKNVKLQLEVARGLRETVGDVSDDELAAWAYEVFDKYLPRSPELARSVGADMGRDVLRGGAAIRAAGDVALGLSALDVGYTLRASGLAASDLPRMAALAERRGQKLSNYNLVRLAEVLNEENLHGESEPVRARREREEVSREAQARQEAEAEAERAEERRVRSMTATAPERDWRTLLETEDGEAPARPHEHLKQTGWRRGADIETDAEPAKAIARLLAKAGMASAAARIKGGDIPPREELLSLARAAKERSNNALLYGKIQELAEALYPSEASRESKAASRGTRAIEHDDPLSRIIDEALAAAAESNNVDMRKWTDVLNRRGRPHPEYLAEFLHDMSFAVVSGAGRQRADLSTRLKRLEAEAKALFGEPSMATRKRAVEREFQAHGVDIADRARLIEHGKPEHEREFQEGVLLDDAVQFGEIAGRSRQIELNPPKSAGTWFVIDYDRGQDRHYIAAWEGNDEDAEEMADSISGTAVAEEDVRGVLDPDDVGNWRYCAGLKRYSTPGPKKGHAEWVRHRRTAVGSNPPQLTPEQKLEERAINKQIKALREKNDALGERRIKIIDEVFEEFSRAGRHGEIDSTIKAPHGFAVCANESAPSALADLLGPVLRSLDNAVNGTNRSCLPLGPATNSGSTP